MWLTILSALSKIPGNIIKYWQYWLLGVLALTSLFTSWEWRRTDAMLIKERAAHAADIASYKNAQAEANTRAQAERAVLQKESKANADQADANYTGLLARYHSSVVRYSQAKRATQQSDNYQLPTPQGGNGPSTSTDLPTSITITGDDAQICAINTARLQAVHDWAITLQKDHVNP